MYLDFFRFKREPFHITPDPEFLFLSRSHQEASASIFYGIEQRKGFIAITGEVGVGKTTILRSYLEGTDPEQVKIIYIFNSTLSFKNLLRQILAELGIEPGDGEPSELIVQLFEYLIQEYRKDRNVVLIIDEAQNMSVDTLEKLRMLSNLETSQDKLVQIVLVGQPEFEQKLDLNELRQLKQRIAIRCKIDALTEEESLAYIQHRIMKASSFHNTVFTKGALKNIIKAANGIPRTINILCDNALITAFGYQRNPVDAKTVKEVIADMKGRRRRTRFRWKPALAAAVIVALAAGFFLFDLGEKLVPHGVRTFLSSAASRLPGMGIGGKTDPVQAANQAQPPSSSVMTSADGASSRVTISGAANGAVEASAEGKPSDAVPTPAGSVASGPIPDKPSQWIWLSNSPDGSSQPGPDAGDSSSASQSVKADGSPGAASSPSSGGSNSGEGARQARDPQPASDPSATPDGGPSQRIAAVQPEKQTPGPSVADKRSSAVTGSAGEKDRNQPGSLSEKETSGQKPPAPTGQNYRSQRIIKKGEFIHTLLLEVYGSMDPQIVNAFRELNPQITNIDRVKAGTLVFLPNPDKIGRIRGSQDEPNRKNF